MSTETTPWEPPTWAERRAHITYWDRGRDPRTVCGTKNGHPTPTSPEAHLCGNLTDWQDYAGLDDCAIIKYRTRHGQTRYRLAHQPCGAMSRDLPTHTGARLARQVGRTVITLPPPERHACAVTGCTSTAVEKHHWAPREIWGTDTADLWPTSYLCIRHHHEWHETMTGYQWGGLTALRRARARKQAA